VSDIIHYKFRQHIEQIIPLTDEEYNFAVAHFSSKTFLKRQYIIQEGNYVDNDYYIVSGLAKSSYTDEQGREYILQFAMNDNWITDPQAFYNRTRATLNVYCIEKCETLSISLENKKKLCASLNKMELFFSKRITEGCIAMQRRILCLISNNAQDRYQDLLANCPGLIQRVPKTMIASYLGVSRETLSRLILS
jgi:CRP-like cAMP-binding protein